MRFKFHQYINPTWFFHLKQNNKARPFPDFESLSESEKQLIKLDKGYSTEGSSKWDAAYQAWHRGIISFSSKPLELEKDPPVVDQYRFLKKYFHPLWSVYVLIIRLLSFKNPVRELSGFLKNRRTKKVDLYSAVFPHSERISEFKSEYLSAEPLVSVVIPTLNRYQYLKDVLIDLQNQDYPNIEVIVVDQSEPFNEDFYSPFELNLQLIHQKEKALWLARNTAIERANGDFLLLFDDDSRVEPDWVRKHLECLDYFKADISSGVSISQVGDKVPANYSFYRWGDQLDTGNVMLKRSVFEELGLFDRQFEKQRMGDAEFGLRSHINGKVNISNPAAQRLHLKVNKGGLRQMGSWDAYRPKNAFAPRPIPSVLYLFRTYFGRRSAILSLLKNVPMSVIPYRLKGNRALLSIGLLVTILMFPLVLIQVIRSWNKSGKMLEEGPRISKLSPRNASLKMN